MRVTKSLVVKATAPDSRGTFEGVIEHNPVAGDKDNERIANWVNLPGRFPLGYAHNVEDPGAEVGTVDVLQLDDRHLKVLGRLDLSNPMAVAVHERLLLSSDDPMSLAELSVGFEYDDRKNTKDERGVTVIHDAALAEVSVVKAGAQATTISAVKAQGTKPFRDRTTTKVASRVKAGSAGEFEALVYGFGLNRLPDSGYNTVFAKSAFDKTVANWRERGAWPTVHYNHDISKPIGVITSMRVTEQGLLVRGKLDLSLERAREVFAEMKAGRVKEFSVNGSPIRSHDYFNEQYGFVTVVDEYDIVEVSVAWAGANRHTSLLDLGTTDDEIDDIHRRLDSLVGAKSASGQKGWAPSVDAFVLAEKERAAREKLDGADQFAWVNQMEQRAQSLQGTTLEDELAEDARDRAREEADRIQRDAEKEADFAALEEADAARREEARRDPHIFAQ
jgi:hypothetical protein